MGWEIVEYQGHPAVTMGWSPNWDKPQNERTLWYHPKEKWDAEYYSRFYGGKLQENDHFLFVNRFTSNYVRLDTTGWVCAQETTPIKPPGRGGKDWAWEWWSGAWRKTYR